MRLLPLVLACAGLGCASRPAAAAALRHPGCFILHDLDRGTQVRVHPAACGRATVPASTFKIPHALIALQTRVITDPMAEVAWDGTPQWNEAWERPHSLATAIRDSVVWFFQRTAVAIGRERMQSFLEALDYGNAEASGELTTFWLDDGALRITGDEQLDFLLRMFRRELPIDRAHVDTVERLMLSDEQVLAPRLPPGEKLPVTDAKIHAKTGTGRGVSWWVGRVTGPRGDFVFVSRVTTTGEPARKSPALTAGLRALVQARAL